MKMFKKIVSIFLAASLSINSIAFCFGSESLEVTSELTSKIIPVYSYFLEAGVWDLLEYEESENGILCYTMRLDNGVITTIKQIDYDDKTVLEITEGDLFNTLEIYNDKHTVLNGKEVTVETITEEDTVQEIQPRTLFEWRESEPYYGSPRMYTKRVSTNKHNLVLEDHIKDIAAGTLIVFISGYVEGFAVFIAEVTAPAEIAEFIKSSYELNDPNTYAIYLKESKYEPEEKYIKPGSGYLKWEQAFYFDRNYSDFAYATHLWGRFGS